MHHFLGHVQATNVQALDHSCVPTRSDASLTTCSTRPSHKVPLSWTRPRHSGHPCVVTPRGHASISLVCLAHRHFAGLVYFSRTPRPSSLRQTPLLHLDTTRIVTLRHASISPGRFARRHSAGHVYVTRTLRASPLRGMRLLQSDARASLLCGTCLLERPPRASP